MERWRMEHDRYRGKRPSRHHLVKIFQSDMIWRRTKIVMKRKKKPKRIAELRRRDAAGHLAKQGPWLHKGAKCWVMYTKSEGGIAG